MKKKKFTNEEVESLIYNTIVPPEVQAEYVSYHDNFDNDIAFNKDQGAEAGKQLMLKKTSLADKKHTLFQLAHTPILSAHNAITRYLKNVDEDLLPWAALAWRESHELVLNVGMQKIFGDSFESEPIVTTGLGGDKEGRLRYCFVLSTVEGIKFTPEQIANIKEILAKVDSDHKAVTESTDFSSNYVLVTTLISMDVAVGTYIEEVINNANTQAQFLRYHYFAVSTHIPTAEEITNYLSELDDESLACNFL